MILYIIYVYHLRGPERVVVPMSTTYRFSIIPLCSPPQGHQEGCCSHGHGGISYRLFVAFTFNHLGYEGVEPSTAALVDGPKLT